jgi:hypothetical protein
MIIMNGFWQNVIKQSRSHNVIFNLKFNRKIISKVAKPIYNSASYIVNRFRNLALRGLCEAEKTETSFCFFGVKIEKNGIQEEREKPPVS